MSERPVRRLYLLRHAKSAWDNPSHSDFERPLAPRGVKACAKMGRMMAHRGWVPERVLLSSAVRTAETWDLLAAELGPTAAEPDNVIRLRELYLAEPERLCSLIRRHGGTARSLLVLGHNPGLHSAAERMIGYGDARKRAALSEKFPTAALAVIDFFLESWTDMALGTGDLIDYVEPRALSDTGKAV